MYLPQDNYKPFHLGINKALNYCFMFCFFVVFFAPHLPTALRKFAPVLSAFLDVVALFNLFAFLDIVI